MSTTSAPAHRSISNIRPSPSTAGPASPHTPTSRILSSNYGSPSALRAEDETVIIEIGARFLRAGSAGDAVPQAVISYGPEEQRRAGDYRRWDSGYDKDWRRRQVGSREWGEKHELWKLDLRNLDLGLVGDKIVRAVRDAYTRFLLIDSRPRRMVLVLPSIVPLPLLSTTLDTLFENFQPPTISLFSSPALTTFAAGLRAALVVDIGWAETIVTGIYEYREIQSHRTIRASKWLGQEMLKMLGSAIQGPKTKGGSENESEEYNYQDAVSFEECEEVINRMAWCKTLQPKDTQLSSSIGSLQIDPSASRETTVSIPLKSTQPPTTLQFPFSKLAEPCEKAFFANGLPAKESDDHELPLPNLIYHTLLHLPLDVRSLCMSRIIFVGGASSIPGLRTRILDELQKTIDERGWDPVTGRAAEAVKAKKKQRGPSLQKSKQSNSGPSEVPTNNLNMEEIPTIISGEEEAMLFQEAADAPQESDPISNHLQRSTSPAPLQGVLRAVDSLGAWTGASLMTSLKIPAVSIVEKETWAMQGLGGAKRVGEMDFSGVSIGKRSSMGAAGALGRGAGGDRSSWTLGSFG